MLALEKGEEVLLILQITFCFWLPEEEGVRRVDIMVWTVRGNQMAPVVRGKIRHTFEMRVQIGSQVNATGRALATMEEWVRVVLVKVVTDWAPPMRKDVNKCSGLDRRSSLRYE